MHKICPVCCLTLPNEKFHKNKNRRDGVSWSCGECISKDKKSRYKYKIKPTAEETKARKVAYKNSWYLKHRERILRKVAARQKRILQADPGMRMILALRSRVRVAIKRQYGNKAAKSMNLTGCSIAFLRQYLEERFTDGMSWANYGRGHGKWNIDHIIPVSSFNLTLEDQQRKCFHYSNLQPLWFMDNMRKGTTMPQSVSSLV